MRSPAHRTWGTGSQTTHRGSDEESGPASQRRVTAQRASGTESGLSGRGRDSGGRPAGRPRSSCQGLVGSRRGYQLVVPRPAAAARHGGRAIYAARGTARRRRSADGAPRSKPRERCRGPSRGGAMGPSTRPTTGEGRPKQRASQGHRPSEDSHNTVPAAVSAAVRLTSGCKPRHARETIGVCGVAASQPSSIRLTNQMSRYF